MISRRTFLRVLGSAAVASALPALPIPTPPVGTCLTLPPAPAYGVLTYEMLQQAIEKISQAHHEPTVLYAHPSVARVYGSLARERGLLYDVDIAS